MTIHPDNPTTSVQPLTPEIRKKILLFTTCCETGLRLVREIRTKVDDVVVETIDDVDQLAHDIARTTPHLLVLHLQGEPDSNHKTCDEIARLYIDLPICLLQGELSDHSEIWRRALQIALAQPVRPQLPRAYAEDCRYIFHDDSLHAYSRGKLNLPRQEPGWQKTCTRQEARFLLQLQTARKNHPAALHYFQCLLAQQAGLDREIAYRLAHGSYKALSWSRDLAAKWLALLAHYVPDVELEFLPIAGSPAPMIDYVHHSMPIEGVYAATLILSCKINPSFEESIKRVVTARFEEQRGDDLLALSLTLYGMAKCLQQVGIAQIELMNDWMRPSVPDSPEGSNTTRNEHRNAGIFRDFYNLGFIIHSPEPLASILKGFHAGTTYVVQERFFPAHAEFRRIYRSAPNRFMMDTAE